MRRLFGIGAAAVFLLVLAAAAFVLWSQEPVIAGIEPPPRSSFDQALIEQGARLAAIGNCTGCHTPPGGAANGGGRPIPTPFGVIYSSNITPAPGIGIGRWSEAAFRRAMREGVSRRGQHLYPAFPYDHFAKVEDDDLHALYAFVMTRRPVETHTPANGLPFPLDQRWLMTLWNALFLDKTPFRPDPAQDAEWNRGAYLVASLGHCGDCHTPRNLLGAEKQAQTLAGGDGEGWHAPALDAASPAPVAWDAAQLYRYLRDGWDPVHGAALGPMQEVVGGLAQAEEADVRAIAVYLASLQAGRTSPTASPGSLMSAADEKLGGALFAGACATCHSEGAAMTPPQGIDLTHSTIVSDTKPTDGILILLDGIKPDGEQPGPMMPSFESAFTDAQAAALLAYIRARYSRAPAWPDLETQFRKIRDSRKR